MQGVPGTPGGRDSTTPKALKGGEGELKPRRFRDLVVFGVALVVLAVDQLSKYWVRGSLVPGVPFDPIPGLRPVLSLTYVTNTGASFGLFPHLGWLYPWIAIAVIAFIVFFYRRLPTHNLLIQISLGMQLGGAIGNNLVDRLWHHIQSRTRFQHLINRLITVKDYCRAPRGRLTTKCYGYNISDKGDESQDIPSRVETGNPNSDVQML